MKKVAFVPARSGSKRVPDKNIKLLNGVPMLAYSVHTALESGVFDDVICATDSEVYADIARFYGADVPLLRDSQISGDESPDIEWILWMLEILSELGREYDVYSILRPTSPFRRVDTIQRAWATFAADPTAHSLRAVEKCHEHPGKMWVLQDSVMYPLLPFRIGDVPWHSNQYGVLPEVYVQNASLEIAWVKKTRETGSIAGDRVLPFITEDYEGFDINAPEDWVVAEHLIREGLVELPALPAFDR